MPFRGKPSLGCENCRRRKIKCDGRRPSCSQCIKSRKTSCSYRDVSCLMILDETNHVERKARKSNLKHKSAEPEETQHQHQHHRPQPQNEQQDTVLDSVQSDKPSEDYSSGDTQMEIFRFNQKAVSKASKLNSGTPHIQDGTHLKTWQYVEKTLPSDWCLLPTVKQLALGVFHAQFINHDAQFSYLPLIPNPGQVDTALSASVEALGVALLSHSGLNVPNMRERARAAHGYSLELLSKALQDPVEALKDRTLLATILVSKFETAYSPVRLTIDTWTKHVEGAAQLARFRGREQFSHPFGFRMFMQTFSNILVGSLHRNTEIPAQLLKLRQYAGSRGAKEHYVWRYVDAMCDLINFRSQYKKDVNMQPSEVIEEAQTLIQQFDDSAGQFSNPRVVNVVPDPALLAVPYVHIHKDLSEVMIWNGLRISRILLYSLIREQIRRLSVTQDVWSPAFSKYRLLYETAGRAALADTHDMCATVPQISGYLAFVQPVNPFEKLPLGRISMKRGLAVWKGGPTSGPIMTTFSQFGELNPVDCEILAEEINKAPSQDPGILASDGPAANEVRYRPETLVWFGPTGLPWLLFLAITQDFATPELRAWAIERMHCFHKEYSNPYAKVLALKMARGEGAEFWQDPAHKCANPWCYGCNPDGDWTLHEASVPNMMGVPDLGDYNITSEMVAAAEEIGGGAQPFGMFDPAIDAILSHDSERGRSAFASPSSSSSSSSSPGGLASSAPSALDEAARVHSAQQGDGEEEEKEDEEMEYPIIDLGDEDAFLCQTSTQDQ